MAVFVCGKEGRELRVVLIVFSLDFGFDPSVLASRGALRVVFVRRITKLLQSSLRTDRGSADRNCAWSRMGTLISTVVIAWSRRYQAVEASADATSAIVDVEASLTYCRVRKFPDTLRRSRVLAADYPIEVSLS
jgi:hypothetical protein